MLGSLLEGIIRRGVNRQVQVAQGNVPPCDGAAGLQPVFTDKQQTELKSNPGQTTQNFGANCCQLMAAILLPIGCNIQQLKTNAMRL